MRRSLTINAIGAVFTALVLVVVLVTKFTHGAWIVVIAMPLVFAAHERHPTPLRPGRGRAAAQARGGAAAQPHPRRRPGLHG